MTTATTKPRQRRVKATGAALITRGQHLIDQGADFLILSARMAETPRPVFWAEGELDARTTLAVQTRDSYDDNYRRVLDEGWDWDWYRGSLLADELERVPVVTVTPDALPVLMPGTRNGELPGDAKISEAVERIWREAVKQGIVPGADTDHSALSEGTAPGPVEYPPAPGPGAPDEDGG